MSDTPVFVEEPAPAVEAQADEEGGLTEVEAEASDESLTNPIVPAPQLVDTRSLNPPGNIEEPVAGSGNPSLIGQVVNETGAQGDSQ
ncbi:hypothetical protein NOLU111490_10865 [Novosphingobium lubricantis]